MLKALDRPSVQPSTQHNKGRTTKGHEHAVSLTPVRGEAAVMGRQPSFFDVDERYAALSAARDPLERLSPVVDSDVFRPVLEAALARSDRHRGGRRTMMPC
jgi:hypothetical protein